MSDVSPAGDDSPPDALNEYGTLDYGTISVLEHIRKRPGIHIGGTDLSALYGLVRELIDNALLETQRASGRDIQVVLRADGSCRIEDSGTGFPVAVLPQYHLPMVELLLTGGIQPRTSLAHPALSGGLFNISPLTCVNALSERLQIEVRRGGYLWRQEYRRGQSCGPLQAVESSATTGTAISFHLDPEIFARDRQLQFPVLEDRLRQLAFLNPGLAFHLSNERQVPARVETYQSTDGVADYVRILNRDRGPVHPNIFHFRAAIEGGEIEVAMQWTSGEGCIESFANYQPTRWGGTHVEGLHEGVREAVLDDWRKRKVLADARPAPNGEDCRAGLTAVLSVRVQEPHFVLATRERLYNPEVIAPIRQATRPNLGRFLATHPVDAEAIFRRVLRARNERLSRRG